MINIVCLRGGVWVDLFGKKMLVRQIKYHPQMPVQLVWYLMLLDVHSIFSVAGGCRTYFRYSGESTSSKMSFVRIKN